MQNNTASCIMVGLIKEINGHDILRRVYSAEGVSPTVVCGGGGNQDIKIIEYIPEDDSFKVKEATKQGYAIAKEGDFISTEHPNSKSRRGRVQKQISATLMTSGGGGGIIVKESMKYRIRKLSPKETFRLQGVKDEDFEKIHKGQSDSSLYHLSGDSITTTVLMAIFGELLDVSYWDKIAEVEKEVSKESRPRSSDDV